MFHSDAHVFSLHTATSSQRSTPSARNARRLAGMSPPAVHTLKYLRTPGSISSSERTSMDTTFGMYETAPWISSR